MGTILMIEDAPGMGNTLQTILGHYGYQTVCTANLADAVRALAAATPDLVLIDLIGPGGDGFRLLHVLRGDARWKDLPVIAVSANDGRETVFQARGLGVREYLVKCHFSVRELVESVRASIARASA